MTGMKRLLPGTRVGALSSQDKPKSRSCSRVPGQTSQGDPGLQLCRRPSL